MGYFKSEISCTEFFSKDGKEVILPKDVFVYSLFRMNFDICLENIVPRSFRGNGCFIKPWWPGLVRDRQRNFNLHSSHAVRVRPGGFKGFYQYRSKVNFILCAHYIHLNAIVKIASFYEHIILILDKEVDLENA
jgi:hypothetical protein